MSFYRAGSATLRCVWYNEHRDGTILAYFKFEKIKSISSVLFPLLELLSGFRSIIERNLAILLGVFLLGTSSSGELCPSGIQNEPPLDARLLADFAPLDGRGIGLKGGR